MPVLIGLGLRIADHKIFPEANEEQTIPETSSDWKYSLRVRTCDDLLVATARNRQAITMAKRLLYYLLLLVSPGNPYLHVNNLN